MANSDWNLGLHGGSDAENAIVVVVQENLRLLATRFAGATAPPAPITYQLWLDETLGVLKQWDGAAWVVLGPRLSIAPLAQCVLLGAVSASRTIPLAIARPRFTVTALKAYSLTATTSDGSNKWTIDLRRDSDSASMFSSPPSTNANDFVAKTTKTYTPNQNTLVMSAGVSLVLTATGTAPTLTDTLWVLEGYEGNP